MSNSPLSRPQVKESVGRSAAELSNTLNFNQSAGMIVPLLARPFIAGTDGYISRSSFCRSKTPLFPAFQSVTEHVDVFLVPLRYIFTPWNDWKLNINDINSSKFADFPSTSIDLSLMTSVPRMDFGSQLYLDIANQFTSNFEKARAINDANRLFDMLGYGNVTQFGTTANVQNLFKLAAYQKVYYDYFRNTSYESNNPFAYNLDWLWKSNNGLLDRSSLSSLNQTSFAFQNLLKLRYCNYRNDYFHNVYPSLNYVVSSPNGQDWSIPSNIVFADLYSSPNSMGLRTSTNGVPGKIGVQSVSSATVQALSVQTIRAAFALDKLMRASAFAPKHVKEQFKARFDVDVPESVGLESVRVGSWQNDIVFGEVTSTANTVDGSGNGDSLGAVGGKGVGTGKDSRIHFHCKEDSILLVVQYFVPMAMYDSRGIDEWNMKLVREDFFQPEFQNLGLRPLYRKALDFVDNAVSDNYLIGYTVPNQSYKVPINRNTGLFNSRFGYAYLQPQQSGQPTLAIDAAAASPLRSFTVHTNDVLINSNQNGVNLNYFKVSPVDLNYLFEEPFDNTINDPRTDQFFGQVRFGIQITHNMSVHGQPSL